MKTNTLPGGTFALADDITVNRVGYGAMQLAGPGVFGPPTDRDACLRVLREALELGIDHIDTSDYYGPSVTNEIIKEALQPYPEGLTIVTKVGALEAFYPAEAYHQDYLTLHPNQPYIAYNDIPKVENLKKLFADNYIEKPTLVSASKATN